MQAAGPAEQNDVDGLTCQQLSSSALRYPRLPIYLSLLISCPSSISECCDTGPAVYLPGHACAESIQLDVGLSRGICKYFAAIAIKVILKFLVIGKRCPMLRIVLVGQARVHRTPTSTLKVTV